VWGSFLIALCICHWKIIIFFLTEKPNAKDAIAFIETNASRGSVAKAIGIALIYVIAFPWIELLIARIASLGKRARNDFHTEEREREIGRRKLIEQKQAQLIELELKNSGDQSKMADIELVKSYQTILSGENFVRWLKDLQNGPIHNSLNNAIVTYLNKVDSIDGKFINPEVESTHKNFVNNLSTLNSALNDGRSKNEEAERAELNKFGHDTLAAHQEYRRKAHDLFGV
jgi:hypothetical protein